MQSVIERDADNAIALSQDQHSELLKEPLAPVDRNKAVEDVDQLAESMGHMNPLLLDRRGTLGFAFSQDTHDNIQALVKTETTEEDAFKTDTEVSD